MTIWLSANQLWSGLWLDLLVNQKAIPFGIALVLAVAVRLAVMQQIWLHQLSRLYLVRVGGL
jgi:hypothetical protein